MGIIRQCQKCGEKKYIEKEGMCLSCIKDKNPDSVLVGLYMQKCEISSMDIDSILEIAQRNFPRIVHTSNRAEIKDFCQTELDIYEDFAVLRDFGVRYVYDEYNQRTKKRRIIEALKDAYRDAIDVKFETEQTSQ